MTDITAAVLFLDSCHGERNLGVAHNFPRQLCAMCASIDVVKTAQPSSAAWTAYRDLFSEIEKERGWSRAQLVDELNKDAKQNSLPTCRYSRRATETWEANPAKVKRANTPRSDEKRAHLHRWFSDQIEEIGKTAEYAARLAAIAPSSTDERPPVLRSNIFTAELSISELAAKFDVDRLEREIMDIVKTAKNKHDLVGRLRAISIEDAKARLWPKVREIASVLAITDDPLNEILTDAGMPPLESGECTINCAKRIQKDPLQLPSHHQQQVWRIATLVYPPSTGNCYHPELKIVARWLAKFWDRSIKFARSQRCLDISEGIAKSRPEIGTQVILLSWLELPLVLQTGNVETGKIGLFELGHWFENDLRNSS